MPPSIDTFVFAGNRRDTDVAAAVAARAGVAGSGQGLQSRHGLAVVPVWYDINGLKLREIKRDEREAMARDDILVVTSHDQLLDCVRSLISGVEAGEIAERYSPARTVLADPVGNLVR